MENLINSILSAAEKVIGRDANALTRLDQLQVWLTPEDKPESQYAPNIHPSPEIRSSAYEPACATSPSPAPDHEDHHFKRRKLLETSSGNDENDENNDEKVEDFSFDLSQPFQPSFDPTPNTRASIPDDSVILSAASSAAGEVFTDTPVQELASIAQLPVLSTQAHFSNWYAYSQPEATQFSPRTDDPALESILGFAPAASYEVDENRGGADEQEGTADMRYSQSETECDISDGDQNDMCVDEEHSEQEGDEESGKKDVLAISNSDFSNNNENENDDDEPIVQGSNEQHHLPIIDIYAYSGSQSQMHTSAAPIDAEALLRVNLPSTANIAARSSSSPSVVTMTANVTADNNSVNPIIEESRSSFHVQINKQDPLYLSHWPAHIWPRTTVLQPLPSIEDISRNLAGTETGSDNNKTLPAAVVYLCQQTLRREGNLALEMSLWLANKLCLPLLAVTAIDESVVEDVARISDGCPNNKNSSSNSRPRNLQGLQSFERKSVEKMSQLLSLQESLAAISVPLIGVTVSGTVRRSVSSFLKGSSSGDGSGSSAPIRSVTSPYMEAMQALSSVASVVTIFTDDCGHPAHEAHCRLLHHWMPTVPLFMVDSDSLVLPKHVFANLTRLIGAETTSTGHDSSADKTAASHDERQCFNSKLFQPELRKVLSQPTRTGRVYMLESEPASDLQRQIAVHLETKISESLASVRSGTVNVLDWSAVRSNLTQSDDATSHMNPLMSVNGTGSGISDRRSVEPTNTSSSSSNPSARPPRVSFDTSAKPDSRGAYNAFSFKTPGSMRPTRIPAQRSFFEQMNKWNMLLAQPVNEFTAYESLEYVAECARTLRQDPRSNESSAIADTFEVIDRVKQIVFYLLRTNAISSVSLIKFLAYLYFENSSSAFGESHLLPMTTQKRGVTEQPQPMQHSDTISTHYDSHILLGGDDKLQFAMSKIDSFLTLFKDGQSVESGSLAVDASSTFFRQLLSLVADCEWSRYLSVSQLSDASIRALFLTQSQATAGQSPGQPRGLSATEKRRLIEIEDVDVPWASLLPIKAIKELSSLCEILRVFNGAFAKVKAMASGATAIVPESCFYPGHLISLRNTQPLFNGLQVSLVRDGIVPMDALLDYYISYLMLKSSPDQGLKTGVTEIATHAKSFVHEDALLIPYVLHRVAQFTLPGIVDALGSLDLSSVESFLAQAKSGGSGGGMSVNMQHAPAPAQQAQAQAQKVLHSVTPMQPGPPRVNPVSAGPNSSHKNIAPHPITAGKPPTTHGSGAGVDSNHSAASHIDVSVVAADFDLPSRLLVALRRQAEATVGEIFVGKIEFLGSSALGKESV